MDFEILMEGTMIGAELKVLSEAGTVNVSKAANANDFASMVIGAIEADLKELDTRAKDILTKATNEKNKLKSADFSGIKEDNKVIAELKKVVKVQDNTSAAQTLNRALGNIIDFAKGINSATTQLKLSMKKRLENAKKQLTENYKKADKAAKPKLGNINVVAKETENVAEKALQDSKTLIDGLVASLKSITVSVDGFSSGLTLDEAIKGLNNNIKAYNKVVNTAVGKAAGLGKLPQVELDVEKSVVASSGNQVVAAQKQSEGALNKLKTKMKDLISKISKELNNPSIATVAISVGIAIVSYLILFGFVKSAGQNVNIVNIPGTFKAAAIVIKDGSLGKKFVAIALLAITVAAFGAAGKAGYSFIKNKLANKG